MIETPRSSTSLTSSNSISTESKTEDLPQQSVANLITNNLSITSTPLAHSEEGEQSQHSTAGKKEGHRSPRKSQSYTMCYLLTFVLCLYLQFAAFARLLRNVEESPEVGSKWTARDIKLPLSLAAPLHHVEDGDILKLENIITKATVTVGVFYAPWSRASRRVIENVAELAVEWEGRDVAFMAVNCWLYLSLCRENSNNWEYPQVLIYHRDLKYMPYSYDLASFPPTLTTYIQRLSEPVAVVRTLEELNEILLRHHRSVLGIFSNYQTNEEYTEFRKAAIVHHLKNSDVHYVPFVVLDSHHTSILDRENRNYLIFKYVLFETLSIFEGRHEKINHKEVLDWLTASGSEPPIRRLTHSHFGSLTNDTKSVILASPLHRHTDNYVTYLRRILSYRYCRLQPQLKVRCRPNKTCSNPCRPDQVLTTDTFLPCFISGHNSDDIVKQCFFNGPKPGLKLIPNSIIDNFLETENFLGIEPSLKTNDPPLKPSEDMTLMTQHTFLESAAMCSEMEVSSCVQFGHLYQLQDELEHSINIAADRIRTVYHGFGCGFRENVFYALDSVSWADMITQFGVNNTDRSHTEALVKVDNHGERLYSFDLTNRTLDDEEQFFTFVWGTDEDSEEHLQNPSGTNRKHDKYSSSTDVAHSDDSTEDSGVNKDSVSETVGDSNEDSATDEIYDSKANKIDISTDQETEFIKEISRLDLTSLEDDSSSDYLVFVYTKWCGFCHVLQRKLEVVARLSDTPFLSFVKVDSDINNQLRESKLGAEQVPAVYILRRDHHEPLVMKLSSRLTSARDIINFIQEHIPGSQFSDSFGIPRLPSVPSVPCSSWFPKTQPPAQSPIDVENLACSQKSAIDLILEGKNEEGNREPVDETDTATTMDQNDTSLNRQIVCKGSITMFKLMSINSGVNPYHRVQVTVNLMHDLYHWRCITYNAGDEGDALWDRVGSACSRTSFSGLPCKYLLTASHITNHYHHTPPEILNILRAKIRAADQKYSSGEKDAVRLGMKPPKHEVMDFERFYLRNCYNFKSDFVFYLKRICSDLCRVTCRVINKLYF